MKKDKKLTLTIWIIHIVLAAQIFISLYILCNY